MIQTKIINLLNFFIHLITFDNHRNFRKKIIKENKKKNDFYDYGENFFYQSIPCIKLRGLRNTKKRIDILKIQQYTKNKTILDIGTNVGSIILNMSENYLEAIGIDYNPKLINIANMIKNYKKKYKTKFICGNFLNYEFNKIFDIIFSFANHSTFDKGINDTELYFAKIKNILSPGGLLLLESHSPLYEKPSDFKNIISHVQEDYSILENGIYYFGNFYDQKRAFYILKKNEV